MRIVVLTDNLIPYRTGFGSAIFVWSFVETLIQRGHEVHLCCYHYDVNLGKDRWENGDYANAKPELDRLGVKVHLIPRKSVDKWRGRLALVKKAIAPNSGSFYHGPAYAADIERYLEEVNPDGIIAWTVDAVASTDGCAGKYPRLALLVDLDHLARQVARQFRPAPTFKKRIYYGIDRLADRKLPSEISRLLSRCEIVIDHAAHHCDWLRAHGVPQAFYLPVPVIDRAGSNWLEERERLTSQNKIVKMLLPGRVTGAATLPGLIFFGHEVMPLIERQIGTTGFEIHIIGSGELTRDLKKAFDRPYVRLRGFVENSQIELQSSDIVLVPTPVELGFRTRIAESFSFGCCVVSHSANGQGMREAVDGENILLAKNASEMAEKIASCIKQPELRKRLGAAARATFEESLDGTKVCNIAIRKLEECVKRRS